MTALTVPSHANEEAALEDVHWKEVNAEFGGQDEEQSSSDDNDQEPSKYRHMEFDFEELNNAITLRTVTSKGSSSGLAVWTCSQILSAYLLEHARLVRGRSVLELGAGLGLTGIVAHVLGAAHVCLTDGDVDVLHNLRYNVQYNNSDNKGTVACPQLVWGHEHVPTFAQTHGAQHDVILAADVFYASHLVQPLWQTVDALLAPDGRFLLGFAPHAVSAHVVLEAARTAGFTWSSPNICHNSDDEKDEDDNNDECFDDFVPGSHDFGYHVFCFKRIAQQQKTLCCGFTKSEILK